MLSDFAGLDMPARALLKLGALRGHVAYEIDPIARKIISNNCRGRGSRDQLRSENFEPCRDSQLLFRVFLVSPTRGSAVRRGGKMSEGGDPWYGTRCSAFFASALGWSPSRTSPLSPRSMVVRHAHGSSTHYRTAEYIMCIIAFFVHLARGCHNLVDGGFLWGCEPIVRREFSTGHVTWRWCHLSLCWDRGARTARMRDGPVDPTASLHETSMPLSWTFSTTESTSTRTTTSSTATRLLAGWGSRKRYPPV